MNSGKPYVVKKIEFRQILNSGAIEFFGQCPKKSLVDSLLLLFFPYEAIETFQYLLERKASMADICDWINETVERHLTSRIEESTTTTTAGEGGGLMAAAKKFLSTWKSIARKIVRILCQPSDEEGRNEAKSIVHQRFLLITTQYAQCDFL